MKAEQADDQVPAGFSGTVYTCSMHPEVRRSVECRTIRYNACGEIGLRTGICY